MKLSICANYLQKTELTDKSAVNMFRLCKEAGFEVVEEPDRAECLLMGFDRELTFRIPSIFPSFITASPQMPIRCPPGPVRYP